MKKKEFQDLKGNVHKGAILSSKNDASVIACEYCEFNHVIPIPDASFLEDYYQNEYLGKRASDDFFQKMESEFKWNEIFHNEKYDVVEDILDHRARTVLDIGSGLGCFLNVGKKRGWDCIGIEPSKDSAKYARKNFKLNISEIFLSSETADQISKHDFIHSQEVIEHLSDPFEMLNIIHALLKPKGIVCISCPNDFNPLQKIANNLVENKDWWVAPPEHLNYFSIDSLSNLLSKCGFEVFHKTSTFPLELFILMGDNYIGNDNIGSIIHKKRMILEENLLNHNQENLRRELYQSLSSLNLGREIAVFARKK
jgi:SAM-dependent methyltransferase